MISLKSIFILLGVIIFLHLLASLNLWYYRFAWFDMLMHFLGGFWSALIFAYLNLKFNQADCKKLWFLGILTISFVSLVGVLWEFSEYLWGIGAYFGNNQYFTGLAQNGLRDTLGDLLFDLMGGLTFFAFWTVLKLKRNFLK